MEVPPLDGADDDPELFAVASDELFVCADTDESARDCPDPAVECFDPDFAPPVPTALPEPAAPDRFDVAVALPDEPTDDEFEPAELEFEPAADDPVDASAHATPYPVENRAAPTPRATASPPTRPTKREAPMIVYLPDQSHTAFAEGKPAERHGFTNCRNCQLCIC
ncbi:hypothetical protein [Mycolicibacterium sp. BK634]|uniref:hypothetical protein n=1 Tax=Mycolicibacterium sp. BK634 TaxID=2587099 RepID=UPI001C85955E